MTILTTKGLNVEVGKIGDQEWKGENWLELNTIRLLNVELRNGYGSIVEFGSSQPNHSQRSLSLIVDNVITRDLNNLRCTTKVAACS